MMITCLHGLCSTVLLSSKVCIPTYCDVQFLLRGICLVALLSFQGRYTDLLQHFIRLDVNVFHFPFFFPKSLYQLIQIRL